MTDSMMREDRTSARRRLLPRGTGDFLRRRVIEVAAVLLALLACAIFLACLTYNPGDPSLNQASADPPRNLLGVPGAVTADLLVQTLGLAAFLIGPILLAWVWRLLRQHAWPHWWRRLALLPVTLVVTAIALAALAPPAGWLPDASLGGALGRILLAQLSTLTGLDQAVAAGLAAPVALISFGFSLGLTGGEWRATGASLLRAGRVARQGVQTATETAKNAADRAEPLLKTTRPAALDDDLEDDDEDLALEGVDLADRQPAVPRNSGKKRAVAERVSAKRSRAKPGRKGQQAAQRRLDLGATGDYEPPALSLMDLPPDAGRDTAVSREALEKNAQLLENVLADFGVKGEIIKVRPGPVVTRYELEPAPGTKTSRVVGLADDIARSLSAVSVRVAVVPGSSAIGIELPNAKREVVYLRELLASEKYEKSGARLPMALGKDISGSPSIADLAGMPHLLVAGTTGSGKSVAVNAMILSLLYRLGPERCKLILIDPKMLELSVYEGIPHLLAPVVTESKKAIVALKWTVREMEERYRAMSRLGVRNLEGYNARIEEARRKGEILTRKVQTGFDPETGQPVVEEEPFDLEALPLIVVVVDELADLMLVAGKDVEGAIQRLAQMARAAGIHLILATQRPSVDVITGTIKANFPTRISFHVTSKIDSRTILGEQGAEQLLGQGDMLYMAHGGRITRIHGPLVTDQEVEEVVAYLKRQGEPSYIEEVTEEAEGEFDLGMPGGDSGDELYDRAVALVLQQRKASTSFVQRHLQIGYNRAARIIERMEAEGVVSAANHVGKREVLPPGGEH